jgi:fructose-1,6-bisphosphatase/inositol monophosphatase family enzyme
MEIYYEAYLQIWDAAAGILIVRNAGGIVSYVRKNDKYGDTALLATNSKLHDNSMEGVFFKEALGNK